MPLESICISEQTSRDRVHKARKELMLHEVSHDIGDDHRPKALACSSYLADFITTAVCH